VREAIDIPRTEDETAAKLKWIQPQFVLTKAGSASAMAALEIIAAKKVQQIRVTQVGDGVRPAMFVDQQREVDAGFFLENARIVAVAQADGRKRSALVVEDLLVFAQLRDVLTAKNSPIVPKKNNHRRLVLPQRTQANFSATGVRENDIGKLSAQSFPHGGPSLKIHDSHVKAALFPLSFPTFVAG
jgi:hypothetical protein